MSSKRAFAMVVLTVGVGGFASSGVVAALDPGAGCGAGYQLLPIAATLDRVDNRPYLAAGTWDQVMAGVTAFDVNADGYLCSKTSPTNNGQDNKSGFEGHWSTGISENRAAGRV